MKNKISKISKIIATFVLATVVMFSNLQTADAAKSSVSIGTATWLPKYIAGVRFHIKPLSGGGYAYCLDLHKATASNIKEYLEGQMDAGFAYILENGYPNKSFTGNKNKDIYITQAAVYWKF